MSGGCDIKLGLANRLVNALAASGEQWKNTVAQLKIDAGVLVGDCLFAAAFVTYSGPFTAQFRNELRRRLRPSRRTSSRTGSR